ncbi:hypothetical protein, partial [Streptomyces sp. NPDC059003]|uniref:hypothetical protein n=1 Tax=Streptomyces sp. NPDC059003 TaxID=3346691 RepID=UPI0036A8E66C
MGESLNLQNRVTDAIHMDPTLTPHRMDQRTGRGHRWGNQNAEIGIHLMGTRHTLDGWEYGILTSKVAGSRVAMSRSVHQALLLEIDEVEADFGTMQAELSGNVYLRQLFDTRGQLAALSSDQRITAGQRLTTRTLLAQKHQQARRLRTALPLRAAALGRIRPTTGDDFTLTIAAVTYDRYTPGARALRTAAVQALTAHASRGSPPPPVSGHFGGLDLAIETTAASQELTVSLHFPDLPGSLIRLAPQDLQDDPGGESLIRRLRHALEAAPQLHESETAELPRLEYEIAQLESAESSDVDYEALIEHTLGRLSHLESIVSACAELDKLPDPSQDSAELHAERSHRQRALDQAVALLEDYDQTAATVAALTRPVQHALQAGAGLDSMTVEAMDQLAGQIESGRSQDPAGDLDFLAEQLEAEADVVEDNGSAEQPQEAAAHLRHAADLARTRAQQLPAPAPPAQESAAPPPPAAEPAEQQALLAQARELSRTLDDEDLPTAQRDQAEARLKELMRQRRLFLGKPEPEDLDDPQERRRALAERDCRQAQARATHYQEKAAALHGEA